MPSDKDRIDWLQRHSYAFVRNRETGKGFINLSDEYTNELKDDVYSIREAIDREIEACSKTTKQEEPSSL